MKGTKPQFVLHFEVQPRPGGDHDGMRRLRAILKLLLRSFGFNCTNIERPGWTPPGANPPEADHEYAVPYPHSPEAGK